MNSVSLKTLFTTHIITDQSSIWNTLTNSAFIPVQFFIGRHTYQSLQGRVYDLAESPIQPPAALSGTAGKIVLYIAAFFAALVLTPCGIVTRGLSFYSKHINETYWAISLQQAPDQELDFLDPSLKTLITNQRTAFIKQALLEGHLQKATDILGTFQSWLKENKSMADVYFNSAVQASDCCIIAEKLQNDTVGKIPHPALLNKFFKLHKFCSDNSEKYANLATVYQNIPQKTQDTLEANHLYFSQLKDQLEDLDIDTTAVADRLSQESQASSYSYPFYIQGEVLKLMKPLLEATVFLGYHEAYSTCIEIMQANSGLALFAKESLPENHPLQKSFISPLQKFCLLELFIKTL